MSVSLRNPRVVFVPTLTGEGDSQWRGWLGSVIATGGAGEARTAVVVIEGGYESGVDELRADPDYVAPAGISIGGFDVANGRITITATGAASEADLQAAIRAVQGRTVGTPTDFRKSITVTVLSVSGDQTLSVGLYLADPFTIVEDRIWERLLEVDELSALLPEHKRIGVQIGTGGADYREATTNQAADLAKILIMPETGDLPELRKASNLNAYEVRYTLGTLTGDLKTITMNYVRWLLLQAFEGGNLDWGLGDLVVHILPVSESVEPQDGEQEGWTSLISLVATLKFSEATSTYMPPVTPAT